MSILIKASPILRTAVARRAQPAVRALHVENVVGNNTPFSYANKKAFAVKLTGFLALGFSIPFIAAGYQLSKSGGAGVAAA